MLRSSASLTASAAKAELNVTLLPDILTRALYARQLHGIHSCRKQLAPYRRSRRAGIGRRRAVELHPAEVQRLSRRHCYANYRNNASRNIGIGTAGKNHRIG